MAIVIVYRMEGLLQRVYTLTVVVHLDTKDCFCSRPFEVIEDKCLAEKNQAITKELDSVRVLTAQSFDVGRSRVKKPSPLAQYLVF